MRSRWLRSCSPTRTEPPRVRSKPFSVVLRSTFFARSGAGGSRRPPVLTPAPSYRGGTPCFPPRDPYPRLARAHHARARGARARGTTGTTKTGTTGTTGTNPGMSLILRPLCGTKRGQGSRGVGGLSTSPSWKAPSQERLLPAHLAKLPRGHDTIELLRHADRVSQKRSGLFHAPSPRLGELVSCSTQGVEGPRCKTRALEPLPKNVVRVPPTLMPPGPPG